MFLISGKNYYNIFVLIRFIVYGVFYLGVGSWFGIFINIYVVVEFGFYKYIIKSLCED